MGIAAGYHSLMAMLLTGCIFLNHRQEELYTSNKIGLSDEHRQIDSVKVFLTAEASGQIGLWIYRRIKLVTQRALKTKAALYQTTRDSQRFFD